MEDSSFNQQAVRSGSMVTATMGYGVLIALAYIVFTLVMFLAEVDKKSPLNYLTFAVIIAGILLAQLNYRNKHLGGLISYGNAFTVGLLSIAFASILIGIFTYINTKYIDPGSIEENLRIMEEEMIARGMSDLEIDEYMAMMGKFQTVGWITFSAIAGNILIGLIISLVTAIIVKKEDLSAMPKV